MHFPHGQFKGKLLNSAKQIRFTYYMAEVIAYNYLTRHAFVKHGCPGGKI